MKNKVLLLLIGAALIMGMITGCGASTSNEIVSDLSSLEATDFEGNPIDSHIFNEYGATIVNIWYTGCGPCVEEMPDLEELYQKLKERNVNFIGIVTDTNDNEKYFEDAKNIIATQGVTYKNLNPIKDSAFEKDFLDPITAFPTTYIVDREGKIVGMPIKGAINDDYKIAKLIEQIDKVLEEDKGK